MTAALLLSLLLYEPGAPSLPQRLYRGAIVARECEAVGVHPVECVATAWVESRFKPEVVSTEGCRGMMQTCGRRASADLVVNARQGAAKLAECHEALPAHPWRCYSCSTAGAKSGKPGCRLHERRVRATIERVGWLLRMMGGEA